MTSATTTESDLSTGYLEVKVGLGEGSLGSPIIEVDTPISPAVVQPFDPAPMSPLKEEDMPPETEPKLIQSFPPLNDPSLLEAGSLFAEAASEGPDPLQFPLPPSPAPSIPPIIVPLDSTQISVNEREVETTTGDDVVPHGDVTPRHGAALHDDTAPHDDAALHNDVTPRDDNFPPQHESEVSSPSDLVQPPAPTDTAPITPPPYQPPSVAPPPPSVPAPGPDRDKEDQEMRDLCIPVLIPPMMFWPISNMRLTYFFTPVLTWWLAKGVLSYPYLYS
jgi:hypothetical protein